MVFQYKPYIIDMFLKDKRYGKLFIGQGHTASDGSSEVDLSGTSIIGYSALSDMAGGQWELTTDVRMIELTFPCFLSIVTQNY